MEWSIDVVELTRQLVGIESVNPPGNEEKCAGFLADLLSRAGFDVRLHVFGERRVNLIANLAGEAPGAPLGFTGHLDTVPCGTADWTHDPHAAGIVGDRLYGRGSSDMKGGIAAFVAACVQVRAALCKSSGVQLILTGGEETGCDGACALVESGGDWLRPLGALVVGEPTENRVLIGHKGALWLRGTARGVTAHGSMPDKGINAIYAAAGALVLIQGFDPGASHPELGKPTLNVGTIRGGMNINSVPDRADFDIDIRTVPGIEHSCLTERLRRHLGYIELSPIVDLPAVYSPKDQPWIARVIELAQARGEVGANTSTAPYFTDAAILSRATGYPPIAIVGPGEMAMAHRTDEYCSIDRLRQATNLYYDILLDWVSRTSSSSAQ